MIRIVGQKWQVQVDKQDILDLEYDLICKLDFSLHFAGPIPFLERYLRIFNLDKVVAKGSVTTIKFLAESLCRLSMRTQSYLRLKSSQVAASALTLAVNLACTKLVEGLEVDEVA